MGKGFYDFTLQNNKERPLLLTLAYEFQMIKDALPKKFKVVIEKTYGLSKIIFGSF